MIANVGKRLLIFFLAFVAAALILPSFTYADTTVASDTFTRTTSSGWGTADTGGSYTLGGTTANFSTNGSVGVMNVTGNGSSNQLTARLDSVSATNTDETVKISVNKLPTSTLHTIYTIARHISTGNEYRMRVTISSAGALSLQASKIVGGTETLLGTQVSSGVSVTANQVFDLHTQFTGTGPTTINSRVWLDGNTEPTTWAYTTTDSESVLQAAGSVGIVSRAGSAAPINFNYDNFTVKDSGPTWKILVLVYQSAEVGFTDSNNVFHDVVATINSSQISSISAEARSFVEQDIPQLDSGFMKATVTVRYPSTGVPSLSSIGSGFWPAQSDVSSDTNSAFDSVIVVWPGNGIDTANNNQAYTLITACGLTPSEGTGQTYSAIPASCVNPYERNVFKHEFAHEITSYYDAANTAPKPAVNVDINYPPNDQYGHCGTGAGYDFAQGVPGDTLANPKPNSIENNQQGFLHDIYSGTTALKTNASACLGVPQAAWASGGPVTRP